MNKKDKIVVCSRSFSRNKILRDELNKKYFNVKYNDTGGQLEGKELVNFLNGSNKAIIGLEYIDYKILNYLPELKLISKYGVGLDKINFEDLKKRNIKFNHTPGVNKRSVSELVISNVISLLRKIPQASLSLQKGHFKQFTGSQLTGKTFGIIGCGFIGKDLAEVLKPFNCKILVNDIKDYTDFYKKNNIIPSSLDNLLSESDIVSLHVPLDKITTNIISKNKLQKMKNDSVIINLARGGLIDEVYLKHCLKTGKLGGAILDVYNSEPKPDNELINLPNVIATPHLGGSSNEAILNMGRAAIAGLKD